MAHRLVIMLVNFLIRMPLCLIHEIKVFTVTAQVVCALANNTNSKYNINQLRLRLNLSNFRLLELQMSTLPCICECIYKHM